MKIFNTLHAGIFRRGLTRAAIVFS